MHPLWDLPRTETDRPRRNILISYLVWLSATRTAKLLPHLWTRPQDIVYVPAFILFGYYFAIMKLYALCTLHEVSWHFVPIRDLPANVCIYRLVGELVPVSVMLPLPLQPWTTWARRTKRPHRHTTHHNNHNHTTANLQTATTSVYRRSRIGTKFQHTLREDSRHINKAATICRWDMQSNLRLLGR